MRKKTSILGLALACALAACGGATTEPSSTTTADTAPESMPPVASGGGGECLLFCARQEGGACMRPDYAAPPDSCGAFVGGQLGAATVACPDACCRAASTAGDDPDADGVAGADDRCPDAPEDVDGFEDHDGCADPDNDGDQLADVDDTCCYVAEDLDEDRDADGCPE